MFCIQENQYFSPAVPGTREKLREILDSSQVKWKIAAIRSLRQPDAVRQWAQNTDYQKFCAKEGQKKKKGEAFTALSDAEKMQRYANALKESLPCLIFGARAFDEVPMKSNPEKMMRRRVLAGIHLSGLFMFDVDHVDNPKGIYERTKAEGFPWEVVFAHKTSSGYGLRLVCKARPEIGNIADNQQALAAALGVTCDASCIDASRISYAPMREDVYYIDEDTLVEYYGEAFAGKYETAYREGRTQGTVPPETKATPAPVPPSDQENEVNLTYHGIEYKKICEAWQAAQGGSRLPLETATEQCCSWLSTLGISATTSRRWSTGCLDCVDLCRTSSASEATRKSATLLIRLVSESSTKTSRKGCKGCLKVWVFMPATPLQLQELWEALKCLTNSSLRGWNLCFAPLMPRPVVE